MKRRVYFLLRYCIALLLPTCVCIIRFKLYKSRVVLYLAGLFTVCCALIAVIKYMIKSENSSIPRKYQYVPEMLRMPLLMAAGYAAVRFAASYSAMLQTVFLIYGACVLGSIPFTVAYNNAVWADFKRDFGRGGNP